MSTTLRIAEVAQRSGFTPATLRYYEDIGLLRPPSRSDAGYRLYDEEAIGRLRAMRALVDEGWSARQAAERVSAASADELTEIGTDSAPGDGRSPIETFVEGAAAIDPAAIERALDDIFASGSFERVVETLLYPALHALGDAWARGEVDVAGEHAASAAAVRRLSAAFEAAGSVETDGRPVLVGLPPGVRHEVAALAFATALRRVGLGVIYLGADVPVPSWVAAVSRTEARAIAFGVVMEGDISAADKVVAALRSAHPQLVIGVGGRHATEVGDAAVLRLPASLTAAVEAMRRAVD
jgi:DNA-binding transcriptional MerR regulator/methylmalonyl-CoA mutase cobalamin-binding subunit